MVEAIIYTNVKLHTCIKCTFEYTNILLKNNIITIQGKPLNFLSNSKNKTTSNRSNICGIIQTCIEKNLLFINPYTFNISNNLKVGRLYTYQDMCKYTLPKNSTDTTGVFVIDNFEKGDEYGKYNITLLNIL